MQWHFALIASFIHFSSCQEDTLEQQLQQDDSFSSFISSFYDADESTDEKTNDDFLWDTDTRESSTASSQSLMSQIFGPRYIERENGNRNYEVFLSASAGKATAGKNSFITLSSYKFENNVTES